MLTIEPRHFKVVSIVISVRGLPLCLPGKLSLVARGLGDMRCIEISLRRSFNRVWIKHKRMLNR